MKVETILESLRKKFPEHTFDAAPEKRKEKWGIPSGFDEACKKEYYRFVVDEKPSRFVYDDFIIDDIELQLPGLDAEKEYEKIITTAFEDEFGARNCQSGRLFRT